MAKKAKIEKIDGLGAKDLSKIRAAVRQVWHRSYPRKLAVARALGADGFPRCELCKKKVPKTFVDHIEAVGDLLNGGIQRMWCASSGLQNLCKKCHDAKTRDERRLNKKSQNERLYQKKKSKDDFY